MVQQEHLEPVDTKETQKTDDMDAEWEEDIQLVGACGDASKALAGRRTVPPRSLIVDLFVMVPRLLSVRLRGNNRLHALFLKQQVHLIPFIRTIHGQHTP